MEAEQLRMEAWLGEIERAWFVDRAVAASEFVRCEGCGGTVWVVLGERPEPCFGF